MRKLAVCTALAAVLIFAAPSFAQYAIDDGSYGYVPPPTGSSVWPNGHEISYTKVLKQSPWFVHGKCTIYKYSTIRNITMWNMFAYYGDVVVQCYPPPDPNGDDNRGVLTYCMEVINWAPGPSGSINLGQFNGSTDQRGAPDCRMFGISRTQPGDGHADPYSGLWVSRAEVRLYLKRGYEFGKRVINGYQWPEGGKDWGNIWVDYENTANAPGGFCTPAGGGPCYNYARVFVADMVGYSSPTPVNWCQDGVCPPPSPPPAEPYPADPEVWVNAREAPEAVASGMPSSTVINTARRRAETFWRNRGQLSSCMDSVPLRWAGQDETLVYTSDNGGVLRKSLRQVAAGVNRGIAYALAFGCNVKNYHSPPKGYVDNPAVVLNRHTKWTVGKLCVNIAHEMGHMDRAAQAYGYTHQDHGGLEIMKDDPTATVGTDWGPCQSG